uniref:NADH-ubiquinone oxidoreductase chain 2 n=1 Tax=Chrysodinopsis sp. EMHAU-1507081 TaxID=2480059 RepID=A0A3G3C777_9CUCU|nr:NADH dehydrogenase subunit 2 [Chrysodinopsis sp. EMHAU-1507081]
MMKYYKIMFFLFMTFGTLITISSYTWLSMWLGLEINLMSIIPLLTNYKNQYASESALKYFITQALASMIFLFSILILMKKVEQLTNWPNNMILMMMYSSIFLKMGAAPFHMWFPEVLEGLSWMNCMIMLTWQKIAPMVIMMNNFKFSLFVMTVIVSSLIFSSILGLNQISLRKILAYSSINHIAWMLSSMFNTKIIWMIYFLIYSIVTMSTILILKKFMISYINQISFSKENKMENLILSANILSLAGLPPFLGFLPKWLTINHLIFDKNYFLAFILVFFTLLAIYFYLRLTFSSISMATVQSVIKLNENMKFYTIFLNIILASGLILSTLILNNF